MSPEQLAKEEVLAQVAAASPSRFSDARERDDALVAALQDVDGAAIVYAPTRRRCEELAELIRAGGRRGATAQEELSDGDVLDGGRDALVYHAGLPARRRREVQDAFLAGGNDTIVATNAFGMGVDRRGTVSHDEGDRVVVLFADLGYRTLSLPLVREKGLLSSPEPIS